LSAASGSGKPGFGGVLHASTLYLIGNIASRAVGFLAIPFYSHYLSAEQYGALELIELSTQAIGITFGLQSVGMVLARLFHDQDTPSGERQIASTSALSAGLLNTVIVGLCMLVAGPLSEQLFHNDQGAGLLQLAFVGMWFSNVAEVALTYERIRERAKFFFCYSMVNLILTLALNIYFIGVAGDGVYGFVYSKLIVTGAGTAYLVVRMGREVGWDWRRQFIPQFIRFGAPLVLASLSAFAIHFSDRFFLSSAVSLADVRWPTASPSWSRCWWATVSARAGT
jgi:O-antigen/teichoic acid export membrane protein